MSRKQHIQFDLLSNARDSLRQAVELLAWRDIGSDHALLNEQTAKRDILRRERLAMIFQQIQKQISSGVTILGTKYTVKGFGQRRGEVALVYRIPSSTGKRPSEKGITKSEFEKAHSQLVTEGRFTRKRFDANFVTATSEPCNFVAMGGVFVMLGIANYKRGEFIHPPSGGMNSQRAQMDAEVRHSTRPRTA